eukprot:scaffold4092_cov157-Pinguiococcus_pyrenoidosus.AAC.1
MFEQRHSWSLRTFDTPLAESDSPGMDTSQECAPQDATLFQQIIGVGQWLVTIGRYDIAFDKRWRCMRVIRTLARCPRR